MRLIVKDMSIKSKREIEEAKMQSQEELRSLFQQITNLADRVVPLHAVIENYFFQDVDYQKLKPLVPIWMVEAGHSPESAMTKEKYEELRQIYCDSLSNRIIHCADVEKIMAAFQDRVMAVRIHINEIYKYLPSYCLYDDSDYESSTIVLGETSDKVHAAINNVFISLCSSFDLFTKIVYECSHYDKAGFDKYKKLSCRIKGILYKKSNYGFDELKSVGLLYSEPVCIRTICSFRDEFIHNGAWDYRCGIYYPIIKDANVEPFVVMPDVNEKGILVSSGSRNKFYTRSKKLNVVLPGLVIDVIQVLAQSLSSFQDVLISKTVNRDKSIATEEALKMLQRNQEISKSDYQRFLSKGGA